MGSSPLSKGGITGTTTQSTSNAPKSFQVNENEGLAASVAATSGRWNAPLWRFSRRLAGRWHDILFTTLSVRLECYKIVPNRAELIQVISYRSHENNILISPWRRHASLDALLTSHMRSGTPCLHRRGSPVDYEALILVPLRVNDGLSLVLRAVMKYMALQALVIFSLRWRCS